MAGDLAAGQQIVALDFGTTKFCIAALKNKGPNEGLCVETVSVPAEGMRRGMVASIADARKALLTLLDAAERQLGSDIRNVIVGVAGSHLRHQIVSTKTTIEGQRVTEADVQLLMKQAEREAQQETREGLHTVPIGYRIDDRETVLDPVGFSGQALTGEFFIIDADRFYLKDLVEVCNQCGIQVERLAAEPFASATVTVPDDAKNLGVAIADIGGGTTDGIVFQNGVPRAAFTVNVGGKLMTSDLAIGLQIPVAEAERVKLHFGIQPLDGAQPIEVRDLQGQLVEVTAHRAVAILSARVHELGSLLAQELKPFKGHLGGGLILTGGGSEVRGIASYYQSRMQIRCHKAKPALPLRNNRSEGDAPLAACDYQPTKFATAIGLINLELSRLQNQQQKGQKRWTQRYLGPLINWLRELS